MYQFAYADILDDAGGTARERERRILDRAIELLEAADAAGAKSQEANNAIFFTRRVWQIFVDDLAQEGNALPPELRASLISIGLWVLRESEQIRLGQSENFRAIIDVTTSIRDGLK
ncbi:MAG: flagellar biosynthesis regulator FlaF [Hyphomicrobiaceae bacterium]